MPVDADKNKLQNWYVGFSKFWKIWKFGDFSFYVKISQMDHIYPSGGRFGPEK